MLILEKPYVSEKLLQIAHQKHYPVLRNAMSEYLQSQGYSLDLCSDEDFVGKYQQIHRLYSMSENGLGWIKKYLDDKDLNDKITLLKDKAAFRRICQKMYPDFYFKEVDLEDLFKIDTQTIPFPIVLKPAVGFLSVGVYVVHDDGQWQSAMEDIRNKFAEASAQFPDFVVGSNKYLIEKYIHGEEYAVDAYFDNEGQPVILNIYHHRFASESDTSDRLYCSNKALYDQYEQPFTDFLIQVNQVVGLQNFPMHIEFRLSEGKPIPIEINPLRFAGFCLNELQTHISGIHPVEAFFENIRISKDEMWKGRETDTFSFMVLERPAQAAKTAIFDKEKFMRSFSGVLELREVKNADVGVAATAFVRTTEEHKHELDTLLRFDMMDFMR
ncbi:MAG: ATP-grasp domain-containing protein [Bacteroidales bacterium]|nr:ATP-grasp domain-containing protein [Bacteroidales bacterium]